MAETRDGFKEIVSGWTLISGLDDITNRIERVGKWMEAGNAPLLPDEEATLRLMIKCQIARGLAEYGLGPIDLERDPE